MKNLKRFLSFILVSVMVLAMSLPVFAAGDGKITITNEQAKNLKYDAYQVLTGEVEEGKLVDIAWGSGVNGEALLAALKADSTVGSIFADATDAVGFAKALEKETNDSKNMQAISKIINENLTFKTNSSTETASPYTISNLEAGYYFVKDASGLAVADERDSKYALVQVIDGSAKIAVKTDVPTQEKKVYENQRDNYTATEVERIKYGEGFNDVADYNIGDTVEFELISKVPNFKGMTSYYYEFQDIMDPGFTFNDDVKVFIDGTELATGNYRVLTDGVDGTTFRVVISNLVSVLNRNEDMIGKEIKVTFSAILNQSAEIGNPGNVNKSRLKYGNTSNELGEPTKWDEVIVFTYELDVTKVDGDFKDDEGNYTKKLAEAEFVFYKNDNGTIRYVRIDARTNRVTSWTTNKNQASILRTGADGTFKIIGLDEGVYYLEETKAPTGYNLLKNPVKVEIKASTNNGHNEIDNALTGTTINIDDQGEKHTGSKVGVEAMDVENNQGVELPETGGMGTTLFYIIGAVMALGAGVVLVTRRRVQK